MKENKEQYTTIKIFPSTVQRLQKYRDKIDKGTYDIAINKMLDNKK